MQFKRLLIDAGHGGGDTGAIANYGHSVIYEKHLNLVTASNIFTRIRGEFLWDVYMTRSKDETLSLQKRALIADNLNAHAFVSIHYNSYTEEAANGFEVHYCQGSFRGKELATHIMSEIAYNFNDSLKNRCIFSSNDLYVLKHTKCPAVLVECGFISNNRNLELLLMPHSQILLAKSICDALKSYFR